MLGLILGPGLVQFCLCKFCVGAQPVELSRRKEGRAFNRVGAGQNIRTAVAVAVALNAAQCASQSVS